MPQLNEFGVMKEKPKKILLNTVITFEILLILCLMSIVDCEK
jgi:hypothetical protein